MKTRKNRYRTVYKNELPFGWKRYWDQWWFWNTIGQQSTFILNSGQVEAVLLWWTGEHWKCTTYCRPITELTSTKIDIVRAVIDQDPYCLYDEIEVETSVSRGTIFWLIHDALKLKKNNITLGTLWVNGQRSCWSRYYL